MSLRFGVEGHASCAHPARTPDQEASKVPSEHSLLRSLPNIMGKIWWHSW